MISKKTVGDVVYTSPELKVGQFYNGTMFVDEMDEFKGRRATIDGVFSISYANGKKEIGYRLDCDDGAKVWTTDMLREYDPASFFECWLFNEIMCLKDEIFICGPDEKVQTQIDVLIDCQKTFNNIFKGVKI